MSERTQIRCTIQRLQCRLRQQLPRSVFENTPADHETAFTICQKGGELCRGNSSSGTITSVSVDVGCPTGWNPVGLYHTHPHGAAIPSDADVTEMKRLRLKNMCIGVPSGPNAGELRCYLVER